MISSDDGPSAAGLQPQSLDSRAPTATWMAMIRDSERYSATDRQAVEGQENRNFVRL